MKVWKAFLPGLKSSLLACFFSWGGQVMESGCSVLGKDVKREGMIAVGCLLKERKLISSSMFHLNQQIHTGFLKR